MRTVSPYSPKFDNKSTDEYFWKYFVRKSGLMQLMTENKKDKILDDLREHPEPFTDQYVYNMSSNLNNLYLENGSLLIEEVYQKLICCHYHGTGYESKKDNLQEVKKQFRCYGSLTYLYNGVLSQNSYRANGVNFEDLYRVFYLLDGKMNSKYSYNFNAIVNEQVEENPQTNTIETEYFKIRHYLNGNNKVTIIRDDLLATLNKIGSGKTSLPDIMSKRYKKEDL